jgi:ABC-type nitrate/sulfonate/bicarbonate transport system substrate-binding protein
VRRQSLFASAAACAVLSQLGLPERVAADSPLSIAGVPEESITPALWAQREGGFQRHGLSIDVQSQSSGAIIAAGVAGGSYAFGKSGIASIVIAHSDVAPHGVPFRER